MIILGIDPGQTIGWCTYDPAAQRVLDAGQYNAGNAYELEELTEVLHTFPGMVAIERPRIYAKGGNDIADTIEQCGWMLGVLGKPPGTSPTVAYPCGVLAFGADVYLLERRVVLAALSQCIGQAVVGDSNVWRALCSFHGVDPRAKREKPRASAPKSAPYKARKSHQPPLDPTPSVIAPPAIPEKMPPHSKSALAVAWALSWYLRMDPVMQGPGAVVYTAVQP